MKNDTQRMLVQSMLRIAGVQMTAVGHSTSR